MNGSSLRTLWILLAAGIVVAALFVVLYGPGLGPRLASPTGRGASVGLFAVDRSRPIDEDFTALAERLAMDFDVRRVEPDSLASMDGLDVLVVVGSGHLPDARLYEMDQFVMRGGRVAFLLNGVSINADETEASAVRGNLFAFADAYGATANPDLVADVLEGSMAYERAIGGYAFWPVGTPQDSGLARSIMPRDAKVVFAWTSSLTVRKKAAHRATVLARSGPETWTTPAFTSVAPDFRPEPDRAAALTGAPPGGSYSLAVCLEGTFGSAFSDLPVIVEHEDGTVEFTDPSDRINDSLPTRVAVVGSSRMFDDEVAAAVPANLEFIANLVGWLGEHPTER